MHAPRRSLNLVVLAACLFAVLAWPAAPARAQAYKPVLAFYYAWYDMTTWAHTPDVPAIQYKSTDVETMARHIDWARSTGIDGFVVSWYGPEGGVHNQTQANVLALLDVAASRGFKIAIDFETRSPFMTTRAKLLEGLRYAVTTLAVHPAYFRYNGEPVIFFWRNDFIAPGEWPAIRAKVDPNRSTLWIAEGVSTGWLNEFDGLHLYNVAWSRDFFQAQNKFAVPTRAACRPGQSGRRSSRRSGR